MCEKGLKIHKNLVTAQLQPLHEKMEKQLKENKAKAAPYRKKQVCWYVVNMNVWGDLFSL